MLKKECFEHAELLPRVQYVQNIYGCITYEVITSPSKLPFAPLDIIVIGADTVETFKVLKYLDSTSPIKFLGFMTTKNGNKTADSFPIGQFFYFHHFSFIRKHVKGSLFQAPR